MEESFSQLRDKLKLKPMVQFKDLPEEIREKMLDEQLRQGNPRNAEVFEENIVASVLKGGFRWDESVEGDHFWAKIIGNGDFSDFYERYPKTSNKLYSEEEVRDLFIKHSKDLYTQHSKFSELLLEQDLKWFEKNKK